tara:strand:- start:38 stop:436 length:399 start_codon:yes stop_codon:yes gene_type:complete
MSWPVKNATPCEEQIRTISAVISAICLVVIAVGLVSAGVYTVNVVHTLEHNHGNLGSMMNDGKEALKSAHNLLQSNQLNPMMDDFHNLVSTMTRLSEEMAAMDINRMLHESETWRNMSSGAMIKMAKAVLEL